MRFIVLFVTLIFPQFIFAKYNVSVYYKNTGNGYALYADNYEYCDVSIELSLDLRNLKYKTQNQELYFIKPRMQNQLLAEFVPVEKGKASGMSFKYYLNLGLSDHAIHESEYPYCLPFEEGRSYKVSQGYSDTGSHAGKPAIDFSMPIGTNIVAAREGIIVSTVDSNKKHCPVEACKKFNNYILIYHPDGTFGSYLHLAHKSIVVKPGEEVFRGQIIGKSGNTGWSTGAHLHFAVYEPNLRTEKFVKTKFVVSFENSPVFLKMGDWYQR